MAVERPQWTPLTEQISKISLQINQTRALLQSLERQREWMIGAKKGLLPRPATPKVTYE